MVAQSSSKRRLNQLGAALTKWRLAFLCFALAYAAILLLNLTKSPILWDEVAHLNGGSFLYWENYDKFVLNAFYPPLFDVITFVSFKVLGVSLFAARLVPVIFSILALWAVFELANCMYGGKIGLLSAVLLGIMPGFFGLSQQALIETSLVFFVVLSLLFFYRWLTLKQDRMLILSGLALGLGFLTKYQIIVAAVIMILSVLVLARKQIKSTLGKFSITIVTAILVISPWIVVAYQAYASNFLNQWLYALQVGNPERSIYSDRFPFPIFYFIEMVWPYNDIHPISIFLYVVGFAGLGLLAWRHRREDKYILLWFACIFIFFTLVENKSWRYLLPLFPTLAISAAVAISALYGKVQTTIKNVCSSATKKRLAKVATGFLIVSVAGAMAYSIYDTYTYVSRYNIDINIDGATNYAFTHMNGNKSIMLLCPFDCFSREMVRFYLWADGDNLIPVFQYPRLPVDSYTLTFNITELIRQCRIFKVQYVFTYENGGTVPYYNTTLNLQQIYIQLYASGNFTHISDNATFGEYPRRIFVLEFIG